jgi:hypothetical protein
VAAPLSRWVTASSLPLGWSGWIIATPGVDNRLCVHAAIPVGDDWEFAQAIMVAQRQNPAGGLVVVPVSIPGGSDGG